MTIHYSNLLKELVKNEWANMEPWRRDVISNDQTHVSTSFNNFSNFVKTRTQQIFEDETRWENQRERWP